MTLVSTKTTQKLFLTTNTKVTSILGKVNIIISPEFYWVRVFTIPVKNETQAKNVVPTLFEDIIDDNETLTYQVIKQDENQYLCFAYNNNKIYEAIKEANIPINQILGVYFAQNECLSLKSFKIDKQRYMYTSDGILVKVPNKMLETATSLKNSIDGLKLSSNKVQIKLYNNFIDTKFYYSLGVLLSILILINIVKYINYSSGISTLESTSSKVIKDSSLPISKLQTQNILKNYNDIVSSEKRKRESISYIFKNKKFIPSSIFLEKKLLTLEYLSVDKKDVETYLKKEFKNVELVQKDFLLKVVIKL